MWRHLRWWSHGTFDGRLRIGQPVRVDQGTQQVRNVNFALQLERDRVDQGVLRAHYSATAESNRSTSSPHGLRGTKQTMPHFVLLLLDQLFGVRNNVRAALPSAERWQRLEQRQVRRWRALRRQRRRKGQVSGGDVEAALLHGSTQRRLGRHSKVVLNSVG